MAKRKEYLSPQDVTIYILAYLYKRPKGAYAYTIQQRANIPSSQESNRFKGILEDLCAKGFLEKELIETSGPTPKTIYKITDKGRKLLEFCRNPLYQEAFNYSIDKLLE